MLNFQNQVPKLSKITIRVPFRWENSNEKMLHEYIPWKLAQNLLWKKKSYKYEIRQVFFYEEWNKLKW